MRRATAADASGILACLHAAFGPFREEYTEAAYRDTVLTPESLPARMSAMTLFVAVVEDGTVIGTVGAAPAESGEGHLRGMAVVPGWQGRGVAESLLLAALTELRARGCTRVSLDTTAPLVRAIRFYEAHGFRPTGRVRDFHGMPLYEYVRPLDATSEAPARSPAGAPEGRRPS